MFILHVHIMSTTSGILEKKGLSVNIFSQVISISSQNLTIIHKELTVYLPL